MPSPDDFKELSNAMQQFRTLNESRRILLDNVGLQSQSPLQDLIQLVKVIDDLKTRSLKSLLIQSLREDLLQPYGLRKTFVSKEKNSRVTQDVLVKEIINLPRCGYLVNLTQPLSDIAPAFVLEDDSVWYYDEDVELWAENMKVNIIEL